MKRIIYSLLALAGLFAMAGCVEDVEPEIITNQEVNFTINTSAPETKTYIEYDSETGIYTPYWHSSDQLGVFFNSWAKGDNVNAIFTNTLPEGPKGTFSGKGTVSSTEQTLYAFYPAGAFAKSFDNYKVGLTIPDLQHPTATSFDKNADLLFSKPYPVTISSQTVVINDMQFARVLSTLKVVVSDNTGEHVLSSDQIQSITLSTNIQNAALTGRFQWDFVNETSDMTVKIPNVTADLSANPIALDGASPIYLLINPITLTSGSKLTVQITTDKHIITKVATMGADLDFPAGKVARLNVKIKDTDTIGGPTPEPTGTGWFLVQDVSWLKVDDQVVITNAGSDKAIGATQNEKNRPAVDVSLNTNTGILDIKTAMPFTLKAGTETGSFAFQDPNTKKYLYHSGSSNVLKSGNLQKNSSWSITISSTRTRIENKENSGRFIQYNPNSGSPIFSTYTGSQTEVLIYKKYTGTPNLGELSITVTPDDENRTIEVAWTDVEHATNYEVTCTGQSIQEIEPGVQSAVFSDLAYDTEYTITVTAIADGYMSSSASDTVTLSDPNAKIIEALITSITNVPAGGVQAATLSDVYTLTNATDEDLIVTTDGTVVTSASAASNGITYDVAANSGNARSGWIKIAVDGGNEITITVSQPAMVYPWAKVYTSNVTMATGSFSYDDALVSIAEVQYDAIKVGKTSDSGTMSITVPAHKTRLYIHAAAWKGVTDLTVNITSNNVTPTPSSLSLVANAGLNNFSPFVFAGDPSSSSYFFVITLPDSDTETTLTFAGSQRFVIWGCNVDDVAIVQTGQAYVHSSGSATLTGSFSEATSTVHASGFLWGLSKTALNNDIQLGSKIGTQGSLEYDLNSNLVCSTTYYYQAYVQVWDELTNSYKPVYGAIRSFTTWESDTSIHPGWMELPAITGNEDYVGEFYGNGDHTAANRNYSYNYNYEHYGCLWVAYPLTSAHLSGSGGSKVWSLNPNIPADQQVWVADYAYGVHYNQGSYARGHQIPNADRQSDATMNAQTYYVTNQTPQLQNGFNSSVWEGLESAVRTEAQKSYVDTVYVVTGACYRTVNGSETINQFTGVTSNPDRPTNPLLLDVPNYYWKALLKVTRDGDGNIVGAQAIGFWFDHKDYGSTKVFTPYAVSIDEIETNTGFDLYANLPASLQTTAEANTSWTDFQNFGQ